jgi:hypothetical protein
MNTRFSETASLVVIGDVDSFATPMTISHDGDFVQVQLAPRFEPARTYAKQIRARLGRTNGEACKLVAQHVEEVAALVSTPALVAWLLDSGFVLTH